MCAPSIICRYRGTRDDGKLKYCMYYIDGVIEKYVF